MPFGITERGDASLNYEWVPKLKEMDGSIIITKKLTEEFKKTVLQYADSPIILHISCTGYGGTVLEPNLDQSEKTLKGIAELIKKGSRSDRIVLRIDPIVPTVIGIHAFENVVIASRRLCPDITRIRVSVMDMYPHVRKRFQSKNLTCPYGSSFQASQAMFDDLNKSIAALKKQFPELVFESCAENKLTETEAVGCVSEKDYRILGIQPPEQSLKGQRKGCLCLGDKTDLLTFRYNATGYNHCYGCLYCYWQTEQDQK